MNRNYSLIIALVFFAVTATASAFPFPRGNFFLRASLNSSNAEVLNWMAPSDTITQYLIYRAVLNGPMPMTPMPIFPFTLVDSTTGTTYTMAGSPQPSTGVNFSLTPLSVTAIPSPGASVPQSFSLDQNYPNPFNPSIQIQFTLPRSEQVTLEIYDVLGRRIAALVQETEPAGSHIVTWDGTDSYGVHVASGVYFYRLSPPDFTSIRKMILLK